MVDLSEIVDRPGRHEDQRARLNGETVEIDVEGGSAVPRPEYLIKIVTMWTLSILAVSKPFGKGADVELFSRADVVIGKGKNRRFRCFQGGNRLSWSDHKQNW